MLEVRAIVDELCLAGGEMHLNPVRDAGTNERGYVEYYLSDDPRHPVARFDVLGSDTGAQLVAAHGRLVYQVAVCDDAMVDMEGVFPPMAGDHYDPPQHLETFGVDQTDEDWRVRLKDKVRKLLAGLFGNVGASWRTIDDIVGHCRKFCEGLAFAVVKKSLASDVRMGWQMFGQNVMSQDQLAIRVISLAQMLQQWGHHDEARQHLGKFFSVFSRDKIFDLFDVVTADTALLVDLRLRQPRLGTDEALRHFRDSVECLRLDKHKGKFLWRMNYDALARGDHAFVGQNLPAYEDATGTDPVCDANAKLVRTAEALVKRDHDETIAYAEEYDRQLQLVLNDYRELPYGAVHGVFSGLSFEAQVRYQLGDRATRRELAGFLRRLELFRSRANLGAYSDGMAELEVMKRALPGPSFDSDHVVLSARGCEWKGLQASLGLTELSALCSDLRSIARSCE